MLARTANLTRPVPVPDSVLVDTDMNGVLSEAVHAHPGSVRTSNSTCAPAAGTFALVGTSVNVQPCPWFTVNVRPAIVSDPERDGPVVDAAVNRTVPFPVPLSPEEIVSHGALLVAVHAQPGAAVTATLPLPPPEATDWVSGAIAYVQPCDCVTVTVCPAIVSEPERDGPGVAATLKVTLPLALPDVEPWIAIHSTVVDAVHVQPFPADTLTVPEPPVAPNW